MARPRVYTPEDKPVERTIRLNPQAFEVACAVARVQRITLNALLKRTVERVFTNQKIRDRYISCYGEPESVSTLTAMVSGSPPSGRLSVREDRAPDSSTATDVSGPVLT